jgi:hypothetical protein
VSLKTKIFYLFVDTADIVFTVTGVNVSAELSAARQAQLAYLNQDVKTTASPSFTSLSLTGLKSGATQGAAGAVADELWHDTGDNTIKIGV